MYLRPPPRHSAAASLRRAESFMGSVEIMLQPIVDVSSGEIVAAESLARFPTGHTVEETFALAYASGRGPELEAACLREALRVGRAELDTGVLLTVNVSPDALNHPAVRSALLCDLTGVVVEITEHATADLAALQRSLGELRARGALIAIDDASTGYAGLLRLTALRPDLVKLDRGLVTGARDSVEQSAVIEALVSLSRRIGAKVLGEGVESLDDLIALAELDVDLAQGFHIARPAHQVPLALPLAAESCRLARASLMEHGALISNTASAGIRGITAALAASVGAADLAAALTAASVNLGIDVIALSTLQPGNVLHEISVAGDAVDDSEYRLADFPATDSALERGTMAEAHLADPLSDAAECEVMRADGIASLLMTPVIGRGRRLGILEFRHRTHRRWSSEDMAQARVLAEHVASVLLRIPQAASRPTSAPRR